MLILGLGACAESPDLADVLGASLDIELTTTLVTSTTKPSSVTPSPSPISPITLSPTPTPSPSVTTTPSPTISPTPTPLICWTGGGQIEQKSLRTNLLPLPLEYFIYLPPCYNQQPERRYPVLYLIHGQSYNNDQWDRLGADEAADTLIAVGEVPPFIIVLPRDRSWAPPDEDMFGKVLVDSLVPHVDENYRTLPDRAYRAIGGLSRGASWAVHLGLSRWELFGAIGAHSLPVFRNDAVHIREWLDAIPLESMPRIYMDTGHRDYLIKSTTWFENLLNEKNIPHEWYLFPGYHEEEYWRSHVEQYLRWYTKEW